MTKKLFNSSAARITRVYALMLVIVTLLTSAAVISYAGANLIHVRQEATESTMKGLKRSFIGDRSMWNWWRFSRANDTKNTFIRVITNPVHKKGQTFYSKNAQRFLKKSKAKPSDPLLLGHIARSKNNVYYYHLKSVTKQDVKENETGVQYDVWLRLDDVIDLMGKIVATILGIALLSFIIGTALIYWVAKRLNRPLVQLTRSSKIHTKDVETAGTAQLPVPKTPQEVHDLSIEFNHLLASLNQRSEADRQFVSNASHELRTPIAGIRGHVEMIKRHGDEHPEIIPTSLDFIDKESKRMQTMIENLLKLSRASQRSLALSDVDLSETVTGIVERYRDGLKRPIELAITPDVKARTNADSVQQILVSLLDNAQKYSPTGSDIKVGLTSDGQYAIMTVADQGRGITDNQKTKVFDRFYRVDQEIPGNGLGLAIVKQLVVSNHGQIKIVDNAPQGSIFQVSFPISM